jgi:hypothetical protein
LRNVPAVENMVCVRMWVASQVKYV